MRIDMAYIRTLVPGPGKQHFVYAVTTHGLLPAQPGSAQGRLSFALRLQLPAVAACPQRRKDGQ